MQIFIRKHTCKRIKRWGRFSWFRYLCSFYINNWLCNCNIIRFKTTIDSFQCLIWRLFIFMSNLDDIKVLKLFTYICFCSIQFYSDLGIGPRVLCGIFTCNTNEISWLREYTICLFVRWLLLLLYIRFP